VSKFGYRAEFVRYECLLVTRQVMARSSSLGYCLSIESGKELMELGIRLPRRLKYFKESFGFTGLE
jgi:hypothetical protein